MLTAYKRCHWFNSDFHSGFLLNDNQKISEISFDVNPFQINVNNNLKVITYVREANQSKPIQIKLKEPYNQSREVFNDDNEGFPIIYTNHTGTEGMNNYYPYSVARLIPQQIPRFTFRVDDNYNQFIGNNYFTSLTNGEVLQVAMGTPTEKFIIFRNSGSFTLTDKVIVDILVVGGGGGGGSTMAGGGGGGGVVYQTNVILNSGNYTVTVGAGGTGNNPSNTTTQVYTEGGNGGDSFIQINSSDLIIKGITYRGKGGGGGGIYNAGAVGTVGKDGGSGGGGGQGNNSGAGGSTTQGNTFFNSITNISGGNNGRQGGDNGLSGGGGGGAGSAATNINGGRGIEVDITGNKSFYAAGGGGGGNTGGLVAGIGGNNVGGDGNYVNDSGTIAVVPLRHNGVANTGSGGGGGAWNYINGVSLNGGGSGGSGVVIIRYRQQRNRIEGITPEETLIQATNTNIPITIDSQYQINYQTPVVLSKGTYETIFNNGAITFKSKPDYSYPTTSNSPIVWYKFDTNSIILDSSGNGYTLINNNNTGIDTSIYVRGDGSVKFVAASSRYFDMPKLNYGTINITNGISFSFWGRFTSSSGTGCAIYQNQGAGGHCLIYRDSSTGNLTFYNETQSPSYTYRFVTTSGINNFDNTWRYYTWTISTSGVWNIYINSAVVSANYSGIVIPTGLNANQTYKSTIGVRFDNLRYLDGYLDDFRIYDYVLSPAEVYDLYNGNTDRSYPILKDANGANINPLVWYQFDGSTSSLVNDASGNGMTLTASSSSPTSDKTSFIKGNSSALFISANNQYFSMPRLNYNTINSANGISFSFWCRLTNSTDNNAGIIEFSSYGATNASILILRNALTNNLRFYSEGGTTVDISTSGTNFFDGAWRHITWTVSKTGFWTIYSNATSILTNAGKILPAFTSATNVDYIGSRSDGVTGIDGNIDDFRIYNIELTATQVSELYNGRLSIYNPPGFILGTEIEPE